MARAAAPRNLSDFKSETIRGAAGFIRVGQTRAGQWWLLDARDRPLFSKGVNAVSQTGRAGGRAGQSGPDSAAVGRVHGAGDPAVFVKSVLDRLRGWQVNTLAAWTAVEFYHRGMDYIVTLEFRRLVPETTIKLGGAMLPDVFDPKWIEACAVRAAEICLEHRERAELVGYFTDHELGWAQPGAEGLFAQVKPEPVAGPRRERPSLLQVCLSLEPSFPAYHAAWEFALAAQAGDLAALAQAWGVPLPNKEALRQLTQADTPLRNEGYLRDNERFSREFARRYFSTCAAAIRRCDPHHLVLGCRFGGPPGAAVVAECVYPQVDVLSANDFHDTLDQRLDGYWRASAMPILIGDFSWAGEYFTQRPPTGEPRGRTTVERMLAKGRIALEQAVVHPAVVGYAWHRWADRPDDGPPFGQGLVHIDGREAREHTELLSDINARAESLRRAAALPAPAL
ncbi:MAG: hypothetical protein EXS39_06365 [Opitutaceae bacterium]|nr:hypothetical protein [Opitutaceae bacterium]